jgi:hypothetical protein
VGPSEEIAVTGVVRSEDPKHDGTLVYGITEEAPDVPTGKKSYYLEGAFDFREYLGQRVTAYGTTWSGGGARVLYVSRVEGQTSP